MILRSRLREAGQIVPVLSRRSRERTGAEFATWLRTALRAARAELTDRYVGS